MKKVIENFVFQVIFQLSKIAIPIISVPIISRALEPEGVGTFSYTNSIVQYVVIFSGLGITLYGNKEIAMNKDDTDNKSTLFWNLVYLKIIVTSILLIIYLFIVANSVYRMIYYAQSLVIISVMFDISWYFMGIEDFKKVSVINLLVQVFTLICIIKFINTPKDLLLYVLIQSLGILLSQILMWPFLINHIVFKKPNIVEIKKQLYRSLPYFIPQIAVLLYVNLNKTMLGIFSSKDYVAYYSNSQTIISMIIMIITTLDTVLLPRMSYLSTKKDNKNILKILNKTIHFQIFISIGCFFGLLSIVDLFVPWFFGNRFDFLKILIPLLSPLIIIVPLGMSISRQYLLPQGKISLYNKSVIVGAVISVFINITTMWKLGIVSAICANLLSEFFVTYTRVKNFIFIEKFKFNVSFIMKSFINGLLMFFVLTFITNKLHFRASYITTIIQIVIGSILYIIGGVLIHFNILKSFSIEYKKKKGNSQ